MEKLEEQKQRESEIERKKKYLIDLQNQYLQKQREIENEILKKKSEQIQMINFKKEADDMKKFMLEKLKKKYFEVLEYNRYVLIYNDEFNIWRNQRKLNTNLRYELFNIMSDYNSIEQAYSDVNPQGGTNYHYRQSEEVLSIADITLVAENDTSTMNISLFERLENLTVEERMNNTSVNLTEEINKILIENFIKNEIVLKFIDEAVNIKETAIKPKEPEIIKNITKSISPDILETINKIQALISERSNEDITVEMPINILIEELFYDIILKQYKTVNSSFVYMMKYKYRISSIFEFLWKVFLSANCDIINNLIEQYVDFSGKKIIKFRSGFNFK
jgi:hypothetical protein